MFATDGSGQGGQAGWGLTSVRTPHTKACRRTRTQGSTPRRLSGRSAGGVITYFNPNQQPGRAPRSDASDQQHRRAQRGLPRADGRARAGAAGRGSAHPLRLADIAICTTSTCRTTARLAHPGRRAMLAASDPLSRSFTSSVVGCFTCPRPSGGRTQWSVGLTITFCEYFTSCSRDWSWS